MRQSGKQQVVGWFAVSLSTALTCFWAFWGIIENFHEGWYYESWASNVGLMLAHYLSPMLVFLGVTLISIAWSRFGGGLHVVVAMLAAGFFNALTNTAALLIILPLIGIGALYWYGRPQPRKLAISLAIGIPALTLILSGISPAIRVSQRVDDGNYESRTVHGNGVDLVWAPDGPGWPRSGGNWYEALQACRQLSEDGLSLSASKQDYWRLPSVEEAVRSMALHGQNSGGVWDADTAQATYSVTPDKETPLWNVHSQVIYWWTATAVDENNAYIIVYDGKVWSKSKQFGPAYLGYRCVRLTPQ